MRIDVERNSDIAMAHQVLEGLGVHARFGHVAAVRMPADVWRDPRHLHPVDTIIFIHHGLHAVLPVKGHQRKACFVQVKESAVPFYHFLYFWFRPVLKDGLEAAVHLVCHGELARSGIRLGGFDHQPHVRQPLQLVVDVDDPVFHVQVADGQPTEFRDPHTGMEEDEDRFVVFAEDIVIVDELEELPHLVAGDRLSRHAVIYDHLRQFKAEGVLYQAVMKKLPLQLLLTTLKTM